MLILIACEFSGKVREAFKQRGHNAWSCDLQDTELPGQHLRCKVELVLKKYKWDMLIAFPPCTYLTSAGMMWNKKMPWRVKETIRALKFVSLLANARIEQICLENPVGILSTYWRKPDQIIEPWQFGHPQTKKTCLWLKNLPKLVPTCMVQPTSSLVQTTPGGRKQSNNRSRTIDGIAKAMAEQWG